VRASRFEREPESLVRELAIKLQERSLYCATAESCTGGWIAQTLTALAGSSDWFDCGFVTYSNESKCRLLGVDREVIDRYGAVSEEVAREMALGAIAGSRAGAAVAVTGIAGPAGGTDEKPVGTVAFGWLVHGMVAPEVETVLLNGDRTEIRWATVVHALAGLHHRI